MDTCSNDNLTAESGVSDKLYANAKAERDELKEKAEAYERDYVNPLREDCVECAEGLGRELDRRCDSLKRRIAELETERIVLESQINSLVAKLGNAEGTNTILERQRDEWKDKAERVGMTNLEWLYRNNSSYREWCQWALKEHPLTFAMDFDTEEAAGEWLMSEHVDEYC